MYVLSRPQVKIPEGLSADLSVDSLLASVLPAYSSQVKHLNSQLHSSAHGPRQVLPGLHFPAQFSGNGL